MKKKLNWGALLEGLGELLITLIFLMIGTVIVGVFAGEPTAEKTDPDTLTFIGMFACIMLLGGLACAIYAVVRFFTKSKKHDRKRIEKTTSNETTGNESDKT